MNGKVKELLENLYQVIKQTQYPIIIEDTNSPCKIWLNYENPEHGASGAITLLECEGIDNCFVKVTVDEQKEKIFMRFPMTPDLNRPCAVLTAKKDGLVVDLQIDK